MQLAALLFPGRRFREIAPIATVAAFTGAWGILSGFVVFICLSQALGGIEGSHGIWVLGGVLAAAVCVASIVEYLRDLVTGHHSPGIGAKRSFARVMSSVLLLMLFEACIIAFEEVSKTGLESAHTISAIVERVTGRDPPRILLYSYGSIRNPQGLAGELEQAAKTVQQGKYRPMLDRIGTTRRWRVFSPASLPSPEEFAVRSARMQQAETRQILQDFARAGENAQPVQSLPEHPKVEVSSTSRIDEGCGVDLDYGEDREIDESASVEVSSTDMALGAMDRDRFASLSASERNDTLCRLLNRMVIDPAFYDPGAFAELDLPAAITEPLERERQVEAKLKRLAKEAPSHERDLEIEELRYQRLPVQDLVLLNQALLAHVFPDHFIKPPPVDMQRWIDAAALAFAWLLSGGILVGGIAMVVFEPAAAEAAMQPRRLLGRSVLRGVLLAIIAAPLAVLAYVLLTRLGVVIADLALDRGATATSIADQFGNHGPLVGIPIAPVYALFKLAHAAPYSWLAALIVLAALAFLRKQIVARIAMTWIGLGLAVLVLSAYSFTGVLTLMALTAMVWIVPGLILGATAPFLRPGAELPAAWGPIGIAGGLLLAVATILRFDHWWWLALPAALLILAGFLIRARWTLDEYWPIMALVLCLSIAGSAALLQQASFRGVLLRLHEVSAVATLHDPNANLTRNIDQILKAIQDKSGTFGPVVPDGKGGFTTGRYVSPLSERLDEEVGYVRQKDLATTRLLELVLVSALGFWAMIGLLAAWSLRMRQNS